VNAREYLKAARFRFNTGPSHVILYVTGRCNATCNHCFYWKEIQEARKEDELTLDEIERISKNFGHIKLLSIAGGEPSLRDDLPEIVKIFYENNGIQNVIIHTHGFFSDKVREISKKIVRENQGLELNLSVSIDALHERHDVIRGVKGGFEKAIRTIRMIAEEKVNFGTLNVTVNTCFTSYNQDDIKEMIDYFYENFDIDGYYVSLVRGNPLDERVKNVDMGKYRDAISHLQKKRIINSYYSNYPLSSLRRTLDFHAPKIVMETVKKKEQVYPCKAGQSVVVISEKGEVFPCEMLNGSNGSAEILSKSALDRVNAGFKGGRTMQDRMLYKCFGNLRDVEYDIRRLLFSEKGRAIKSFIKKKNCQCTWECAIMNNIIFNWRAYPGLLSTWVLLESKKVF